ncbi:MAG: hypothetical protein LQ349_007002 [Xanthoria aureola]|nr:MAG: hypothetical protein LQ349_007002 [Xanthoria aureola]
MMGSPGRLNEVLLTHWSRLENPPAGPHAIKAINGHNLDIATVVLVARLNAAVQVSDDAQHAIIKGAKAFEAKSATGEAIYGINTGFGGSADIRTKASNKLKEDLLSSLHYGILAETTTSQGCLDHDKDSQETDLLKSVLRLTHEFATVMPESWIRASILVTLNSLAHGVSGITLPTIEALLRLLDCSVTPRVPLHGSISASGDVSPLAYIAGVLEGKPSLTVYTRERQNTQRRVERADIALTNNSMTPIVLTARDCLALDNGTSVSAAVAALAMHEALGLAALSQVLTAMSVEALRGTDESFDPFLAAVRPHLGQVESSRNISIMLEGSRLVDRGRGLDASSLRQDHYSLRTASQWLGPTLEDLSLANTQITVELNSATDNPLIDASISRPRVLYGGNFQAKAITSAVEKIRQGAQSIGRILFAQCTELINPVTSLASHVQTAEMGNQGVNSLALISCRYTLDALDILSSLPLQHLVAVCQALDLRALQWRFLATLEPEFRASIRQSIATHLANPESIDNLLDRCWNTFCARLDATTTLGSVPRFSEAIASLQPLIMPSLMSSGEAFRALVCCNEHLHDFTRKLFTDIRRQYVREGDAAELLGRASKQMYRYIRKDLGIRFIGGPETLAVPADPEQSGTGLTMGALNSRVRAAMVAGKLYQVVMGCIKETERPNPSVLAKL